MRVGLIRHFGPLICGAVVFMVAPSPFPLNLKFSQNTIVSRTGFWNVQKPLTTT